MTRTIIALSFALTALAAAGGLLSACGRAPDGENMVTYRETDGSEPYAPPSETDGPAPCTPEDGCANDSDCDTGFFCNTEECVCQEVL